MNIMNSFCLRASFQPPEAYMQLLSKSWTALAIRLKIGMPHTESLICVFSFPLNISFFFFKHFSHSIYQ